MDAFAMESRVQLFKFPIRLALAILIVGLLPLKMAAASSGGDRRSLVYVKYQSSAFDFFNGAGIRPTRENLQLAMRSQTATIESSVFQAMIADSKVSVQTFWLGGGAIANLTRAQIKIVLQSPFVESVLKLGRRAHLTDPPETDAPVAAVTRRPTDTYGLEQIRVPELRFRHFGLDGTSVRVGIIDTGVDANHPDLNGRVLHYRDWVDPKVTVPRDDHGHGTHVAGTIGGANTSGLSIGVAPKVGFVIAKAFNRSGNSKDSDLLAALQWMADPDGQPATDDAPRVINNSWNVDGNIGSLDPAQDPFCVAIDGLAKLGITTVVAAGNDGSSRNTIKIPGACPGALTVAATDRGDQIVSFSSRGPAIWKTGSIAKPDVAAPGKDVESADPGGGYRTRSGTSMASPHVAGAVAILLQAKPGLTSDEVKSALMTTAEDIESKGADVAAGAGRIDLVRAVDSL
jgi:subtilisin family serine protease